MRRRTLTVLTTLALIAPGGSANAGCTQPRITRVATKPAALRRAQPFTLRVSATMPGGALYAVDVLWGVRGQRDHLTLAPAFRKRSYVFELRHRYSASGRYKLTVRAYGAAGSCRRSSAAAQPTLTVS